VISHAVGGAAKHALWMRVLKSDVAKLAALVRGREESFHGETLDVLPMQGIVVLNVRYVKFHFCNAILLPDNFQNSAIYPLNRSIFDFRCNG